MNRKSWGFSFRNYAHPESAVSECSAAAGLAALGKTACVADQTPFLVAHDAAAFRTDPEHVRLNRRRVDERLEDALVVWNQLEFVKGPSLTLLREGKQVEVRLTSDLLPGFFGPSVKPLGDDLFEVTFTYRPKKTAEAVYLAGSFNNWKPTAHKMEGPDQEGCFTARLRLKKGRYEYKFVLDGQTWESDPENVCQTGPYRNSVFQLGER